MENQATEATKAPRRRVSAVLRQAALRLISGGVESGALDAELILGHVLGITREQIVVVANTPLDDAHWRAYEGLLLRRLKREPAAYITGRREFWSLDFHVTPDVLIPRPETELLVEIALGLGGEFSSRALRIVDVGTGSGAIAVALASQLAGAEIFATDISAAALVVAKGNAVRNHVAGKIQFVQGDLFRPLRMDSQLDLIVSNPPYVRRDDIDALEAEVSRWEPRAALDGGLDGLDYYRRIAAQAFHYLAPNGAVAVEIGAGTGEAVAALFKDAAECAGVKIHKDYAGHDRVLVARKIAESTNSI
jgi:release factor glutamine methyltransferase